MLKEERGAIIVEATISLTVYLFAFLMIFSLIHLCRVQMKVSVAVNNAAKEISQYSYLYGVSGLSESMANAGNKAESEQKEYEGLASDVGTLYQSILDLGKKAGNAGGLQSVNPDNIKNLEGQLNGIKGTVGSIAGVLKEKADNPKEMLMGVCSIMAANASEEVKTVLAEYMAKALVKQNLKTKVSDTDVQINDYLRQLGIKKKGDSYFDSIDFGYSELFPYGKNEIKIVAVYDVRLLPLLNVDTSFTIVQTAKTRAWLKGDEDKK